MFNKEKFANILAKINNTYSSMTEFAQKAELNRTYISKYINMKLNNPPTPKILSKIANTSNGITTYSELMLICNYLDSEFNNLMGDKIKLYDNPYSVNLKYNQIETFIFDVIYSYENIKRLDFDEDEKLQITQIYNYIKNDKVYCELIKEYTKLKEQYQKNIQVDIDEADIAFASGIKGLNETNKMIIKNTLEALLAKQEQDKNNDNERNK